VLPPRTEIPSVGSGQVFVALRIPESARSSRMTMRAIGGVRSSHGQRRPRLPLLVAYTLIAAKKKSRQRSVISSQFPPPHRNCHSEPLYENSFATTVRNLFADLIRHAVFADSAYSWWQETLRPLPAARAGTPVPTVVRNGHFSGTRAWQTANNATMGTGVCDETKRWVAPTLQEISAQVGNQYKRLGRW
jgi:hypothetical protein